MRRFLVTMGVVALAALTPAVSLGDDQTIAETIIQRLQRERDGGNLAGFNIKLEVDQGTVWVATTVETKPNMLNAYMKNLSQVWRAFMEKQMETGDVVSYKMFQVTNPREGEADLVLMTEFKNMAVFDRGIEFFEKQAAEVMGSMEEMQTDNIAREEMRTIKSTVMLRELHFREMDE